LQVRLKFLERAMGIEPTSRVPQVIESTHLTSPIWAQMGAESRLLCPPHHAENRQ